MIDTHTHLYMSDAFTQEDGGPEKAVERALEAGVRHLIFPNVDVKSVRPLLDLHTKFPKETSVAPGLHPTEVTQNWKADIKEILYRFGDTPYKAIGEIGVDLHWGDDNIIMQMDAFGEQLQMAYEKEKVVIVHSRDAWDETFEIIDKMGNQKPPILFHSFTSGPTEANRILTNYPDAYFAINGVVTFKNGKDIREAVKLIGADRLMLETDSPYLAPVPYRGRRNESAYLGNILSVLAETLELPEADVERITDNTAINYFRLKI